MLKVLIALSGWFLLVLYLLYERQEYGDAILHHLFSPGQSGVSMIFHAVIVTVPVAGTYMAYLLHQRDRLMSELARGERVQALGEMSQGVAHDFDILLSSVSDDIARALERKDRPEESAICLGKAQGVVREARELVGELLDFSMGVISASRTVLVEDVVKRACEAASRGASSECSHELPDDLWPVEADERSLMRALATVVSSTVHIAPHGAVVRVRCENVSLRGEMSLPLSKGQYVRIFVVFPGGNVSDLQLQRLFDPYGLDVPEGGALSLARAFAVVKRHGGHLTVVRQESSVVLSAYLPVARAARGKE